MKFYKCEICGNIIEFRKESGVTVVCCGQDMEEIIPGTSDGAAEKHVPVIAIDGNKVTVTVGSVLHPSLDAHYIEWIALETKKGAHRVDLAPGDIPTAEFLLAEGDEAVAAYEYCNLHDLWKAEV